MNKFPLVVEATAQHVARNIRQSTRSYIVDQISNLQVKNPIVIGELCSYAAELGSTGRSEFGFDNLSYMYLINSVVGGGIVVYNMLLSQFEADELASEPDTLISPAHRAALEAAANYENNSTDESRFNNWITLRYNDGSNLEFKRAYGVRFGRWIIVISENHKTWCSLDDELESISSSAEVRVL